MKFIKEMPFHSVLEDNEFTCVLWQSHENICDYMEESDGYGTCDTSGFYYGTNDEREPKYCARHYYHDLNSGDGIDNYGLKDVNESSKAESQRTTDTVQEATHNLQ